MHFKCIRCARRHSFPAARMNAAGRVPCKCGATLILDPPHGKSQSSPGLMEADILTLGYKIRVETSPRSFDTAHEALRAGVGLGLRDTGAADPSRAANPALLWPALGASMDPRLFLPAVLLAFGALLLPEALHRTLDPGPVASLVGLMTGIAASAFALSLGSAAAAVALHVALVEGKPGSAARALGGFLVGGQRRGLAVSALRHAFVAALAAGACVLGVAVLLALGRAGAGGALAAGFTAPVQALLAVGALAAALGLVGMNLAHAAVAPQSTGLFAVQVEQNARRVLGPRGRNMLRKPFNAAMGAAILVGLAALGLLAALIGVWEGLIAAFGAPEAAPHEATAIGRALGRALLGALAAGVWTTFVGVVGLLGGYALGIGAARAPVRTPEIITGTQRAMQAVIDSDLGGEEKGELSDSVPPPSNDDP